MKWPPLLLTLLLALPFPGIAEGLPLEFKQGDRILLYGNSFVERMQETGRFEAVLQLANPGKELEFRSLAWTGDEVGYRLRPERYANHLRKLLAEWPADIVILAGFGWYESFAGAAGLASFETNLRTYLREIEQRHSNAKIVLMLPPRIPLMTAGNHLTDAPADLDAYAQVMTEAASAAEVQTVDLGMFQAESQGSAAIRDLEVWAAQEISGTKQVDPQRLAEVAQAVSQKARYVGTLVRPINAVVYFGVRGRPDEYDTEMPRYHALVKQSDAVIHDLVAHPGKKFADCPVPSLPPLDQAARRGGEKEGVILPAAAQEKTIRVAEGYRLNLFASEEQFPDLRNPVQIAFGPRGRLWVVTMPSFPHTVPGEQPKDKILVLEDTDRDGMADRQTVFADGLNVPDGLVFYRDGVIVSAQPRLLYLRDTDGDGRADSSTEMLRGIDVTDAHHGGMIAMDPVGDVMLCDGVFHRSQFETPFGIVRGVDATTYRFDLRTGRIENEYQTLTPNPWKITFDRWGNLFHMYGDGFVQDSQAIPWTPLGIYHPFNRAVSIAYGKGSGAAVISGPNFPADYQQGMASATLLGNSFVALSKLNPASGLNTASDRINLVQSDNLAFRPVDMAFGFDGAMYISDFCSPIVGHAQHPMRDPRWDHDHGRIWRVAYAGNPVVQDWPDVAEADTAGLLALLGYPQDNVRDLARVRLRNTAGLAAILDAHLNENRPDPLSGEQLLELLWLYESAHQVRPVLLETLLASGDFHLRAAATRLLRFQAERLPDAFEILARQATDPHPRVRIEVINAISHLQQRDAKWASLLGKIDAAGYPAVETMLADASHGTTPAKGPEVPLLNIPRDTQLRTWLNGEEVVVVEQNGKRDLKEALLRTYVVSDRAQTAVLSLSHQHVQVTVNGAQLLNADTWWSSDWNLQVPLRKGVNEIEIAFGGGGRAQGVAPIYLFDPTGIALTNLTIPASGQDLRQAASAYAKVHGIDQNTVRLSAVPNQLAFAPRELRMQPGQEVRFLFDNPDLQIHNVVIIKPGTLERVGLLADHLALDPAAAKRHYVPADEAVLWSTPLVNAKDKIERDFTAPSHPGRYPILCTFPGHWRVMRATLIVE